jgi:hypothetical protein
MEKTMLREGKMKSAYDWKSAAISTGSHKHTIALAKEINADRWAVVRVSMRRYSLFTGESVNLIPSTEVIVKQHP